MFSAQGLADSATLSSYLDRVDSDRSAACIFGGRCLLHGAAHDPNLCITTELQQLHDLDMLIRQFESILRRKGFSPVRSLQARKPDVSGIYRWSCPMELRHVRKSISLSQLSSYAGDLDDLISEFVEERDAAA